MAKKKLPKIRIEIKGDPAAGEGYHIFAISEEWESYDERIASIELYGEKNVMRACGKNWAKIDSVANAFVNFRYQRRGLGTLLYDKAEELTGCKLVPWVIIDGGEEPMSSAAKAFWAARGGYSFEDDEDEDDGGDDE